MIARLASGPSLAGRRCPQPAPQLVDPLAARRGHASYSLALFLLSTLWLPAADKKIIFIAGRPSHATGEHEYRAGCLLLKKCLDPLPGINSIVYSNGWPAEPSALDDAAAIIIYSDGGPRHPVLEDDHEKILSRILEKGAGLGCLHFAVEIPKANGGAEFLQWLGGYYEVGFSINPVWTPEFTRLPNHPITRGVKPFSIKDEWYFNIRLSADSQRLAPILKIPPSDNVRLGPYHDRYPDVEKNLGRDETLMWAYERPNGGRSFGFTGGHFHENWVDANFRKLVLNAIVWIAKSGVPNSGVSSTVTSDELKLNLDPKPRRADLPPPANSDRRTSHTFNQPFQNHTLLRVKTPARRIPTFEV